jgi:hypothetical protein
MPTTFGCKTKVKIPLGNLGKDVNVILQLVLKKLGVKKLAGFIWLMTWTSGRIL